MENVVTDCDIKPYDIDPITKVRTFNEKIKKSKEAEEEKNRYYSMGSVRGFASLEDRERKEIEYGCYF